MTMYIEIPFNMENQIRESIALGDANTVQILLAEAIAPKVKELMKSGQSSQLSNEKFETLSDQLADELLLHADSNRSPLSDFAVSRTGLYEDHL